MSSNFEFGIDLGTTNSAVARSNDVEVHVYQHGQQMNVTPSAVHIHKNGRTLVGQKAHSAIINDPTNVATEFKRSMGQKLAVTFPASGQSKTPEELSAEVLKSLKDDVRSSESEALEITRAVVTVPAAFSTLQCEATSRAASLAGITETYLLQEPIAAAIAYGAQPGANDKRWMVFDLGGGTLDIAVVSTRNGQLTVLEHQGNNLLGGKDMDRVIADEIFLPVLAREFNLPEAGSPEYHSFLRRLLRHAEQSKIDLSIKSEIVITLADLGADRKGNAIETEIVVKRSDFERRIEPLVHTCVHTAKQAMATARVSASDLDQVLLVGGPTRIPYVRAALVEAIGAKLNTSINPMTVVAQGAAIFAASVDWKPKESMRRTAGAATLSLGYEKTTSALQEPVLGRVESSEPIDAIKIDADGGYWTSGWMPLRNGTFETRVQLLEGKSTQFWIYARRADGSLIDIEPNFLNIRHGLVPCAPPLPHSIGIEVVKPDGRAEIDIIFPKGRLLPAEEVVRYRAARQLRATTPDEVLAIKIWEGEVIEDPAANLWVSAMPIYGRQIQRPIALDAEVQLTVRIDTSRRISVDVFLPGTNQSISDGVYIPEREQHDPREKLQQLPDSIAELSNRLDAVEDSRTSGEDAVDYGEILGMRKEIEDVDLALASSERLSNDSDHASRLLEQTRQLRRKITDLEKSAKKDPVISRAIENARAKTDPAKQIADKYGSDQEKSELAELIRSLDQAEKRGDIRGAQRAAEQAQSLRWRVLYEQDWYWKNSFEALKSQRDFVNRQESQKWLDIGEEAILKGNSKSLRNAVEHLWDLRPKSDAEIDEEQAMLSGLRRA